MPDKPLVATCHCGRVRLTVPGPPEYLNECLCSVCYKYGAAWAYYPQAAVEIAVAGQPAVSGASAAATATTPLPGLDLYIRDINGTPGHLSFNRCAHCGCMTHWSRISAQRAAHPETDIGVNSRLIPVTDLEGVERKVSTEPL